MAVEQLQCAPAEERQEFHLGFLRWEGSAGSRVAEEKGGAYHSRYLLQQEAVNLFGSTISEVPDRQEFHQPGKDATGRLVDIEGAF